MIVETRFTEMVRIDPTHYPDTRAIQTYVSSPFSMRDYGRAAFIIQVGEIADGGTVNAHLEQEKTAAGVEYKDITGKAITQLTAADANSVVVIELDADELDVDNAYDHVRLRIIIGGNTVECAALIQRFAPLYAPVGVTQLAEVVD